MFTFGSTIVLTGELRASEDVTIEGRVEGDVVCEGAAVTLAAGAVVRGDVIARDITVFGRADGQLVATDVVDIRAGAVMSGQVVSARVILQEGATFNGRVAPQHLEAALRVSRFNRQREAPEAAPARRAT
ncbi:MAG TPA: polymer-forming cytoskeletal protein [Vicinamibacterales bacterium]|nr:polymer-forming cytoskeletal protein [Vicinamibacterales bacterium]